MNHKMKITIIFPGREVEMGKANMPVMPLAPTLLAAAGVDVPGSMQGSSYLELAAGTESAWRDSVYYARVFEEPIQAINAGGIRCDRDAEGRCIEAKLCPGPEGDADDCLSGYEPRAWSSPIYLDFAAAGDPATSVQ